ncbi:sigma factor [Streptomyces kaempferi]
MPITELLDERRFLLDVAYWMLGSPAAAESVVDQTYRRWYELSDAERHRIGVPRSWLARTAGGICLDRLARRPGCDGPQR